MINGGIFNNFRENILPHSKEHSLFKNLFNISTFSIIRTYVTLGIWASLVPSLSCTSMPDAGNTPGTDSIFFLQTSVLITYPFLNLLNKSAQNSPLQEQVTLCSTGHSQFIQDQKIVLTSSHYINKYKEHLRDALCFWRRQKIYITEREHLTSLSKKSVRFGLIVFYSPQEQ